MRVRDGIAVLFTMLAFVPAAVAKDETPETKNQPQAEAAQQADQQRADQQKADEQNKQQDQAKNSEQANAADKKMEAMLASCLALSNHEEIELAKVAIDRTQNPDVRNLAQQILDDHQAEVDKLRQFIPNADEHTAQNAGQTDAEKNQSANAAHNPMQRMMQKIAKNELEMTKEVLKRYEGKDFDMAFLGQQIMAHTQMLAKLYAMEDQCSPQFQAAVKDMIKASDKHFRETAHLSRLLEEREFRTANTSTSNNSNRRAFNTQPQGNQRPAAGNIQGTQNPQARPTQGVEQNNDRAGNPIVE